MTPSLSSTPLLLFFICPAITLWECAKKAGDEKKCFLTAVPVDETQAGLNHSFFPPHPQFFFTSLHHPLFSVSFDSGVSFPFFYSQFTIFCVVSQFHLFKGRDQHLAQFRSGFGADGPSWGK